MLATEPEVLILDEPAAGLDPSGRERLWGELHKIRKERNTTIVLISHSMEDLAQNAERIIVLNNGEKYDIQKGNKIVMSITQKVKKLGKFIVDADFRFLVLSNLGRYDKMDDAEYLKRKYKAIFHRELDLENPQSFNEKLQWLKLYDRQPTYPRMVDKYAAKEYVASIIGSEHIIPTLGVWDSFDEIDFDSLPDKFVLKCTHDSGGIVICKDKSKLDLAAAKSKIEKWRKSAKNFFHFCAPLVFVFFVYLNLDEYIKGLLIPCDYYFNFM